MALNENLNSGTAGGNAVTGGVGAMFGMATDAWNNAEQRNANKNSQKRQFRYNDMMAERNQMRAMEMIDYTNPKNTLRRLKEAGLNAGLMLGQGGAGGNTATASGAGEGSGVGMMPYTPSQQGTVAGLNNVAELALLNAQTKNIEADTKKKEAEVPNIGADTENIGADTALKQMQTENQKLLNNITSESTDALIGTAIANYNKAEGEASTAVSEGRHAEETQIATVYKLQQEGALTAMKISAEKAGIKLTEEQTRAIAQELAQGWEELYQKARGNDNQAGMVNIAGFKAKADYAIDKANVDLRGKELMVKGAEAFIKGIKPSGRGKGSTTETHKDEDGTIIKHTTNH